MLTDSYTFQQTTPPQTRPRAHMRVHMDLFENSRRFIIHLYTLYNFKHALALLRSFGEL